MNVGRNEHVDIGKIRRVRNFIKTISIHDAQWADSSAVDFSITEKGVSHLELISVYLNFNR